MDAKALVAAQPQVSLVMPTGHQWSMMKEQAEIMLASGFLPSSIKSPAQAITIMLKGFEIGIPPMQAFAQISVINGKPAMGAELMLFKIYQARPDADIEILQNDEQGAVVQARRGPKNKYAEFSFKLEDAKKADLLGKDSWKKYPKNMMLWRAISAMARAIFPECLHGISHTPEELGAEVNADGDVIDVPAERPKPAVQVVKERHEEDRKASEEKDIKDLQDQVECLMKDCTDIGAKAGEMMTKIAYPIGTKLKDIKNPDVLAGFVQALREYRGSLGSKS